MSLFAVLRARLAPLFLPLFNSVALFLIAPSAFALYCIDPAMLQTIAQWLLVAPMIAGLSIMVALLIFPQINVGALVAEVKDRNLAAGILSGALVLFVAIIFIGLVLWARA